MNRQEIWTVGHSNHELDYFLAMLAQASIELVVDVRRFPGSRRHTQFQRENLERSLGETDIHYRHEPRLGGRRSRRAPDSPNNAWRVEAFNAYADHMQTAEFRDAFAELEKLAQRERTAIMCAEALPWRCHRRLIADALVAAGWQVTDIYAPGKTKPHSLTDFAKVQGGQVIYPGPLF